MDFSQAKDELLKWIVPALLTGIFYAVVDLKSDMIAMKQDLKYSAVRSEDQSKSLVDIRRDVNANIIRLTRIEMKVGI